MKSLVLVAGLMALAHQDRVSEAWGDARARARSSHKNLSQLRSDRSILDTPIYLKIIE